MGAVSVVETELKNGNIKKINVEKREDVFKEQCEKLYEDLNLPNLPHEQRTKRTNTIETRRDKGGLWECYEDKENSKIHNIKELQLTGNLDLGDKRVFEIQRIEYDVCGFCGHELIAEDYSKGVRVCEGCGTVENTYIPEILNETIEPDRKLGSAEIEFEDGVEYNKALKESVTRLNNTPESQYGDMEAWRRQQYHNFIDILSSQLHMNANQKATVEHIIDTYKLKQLHPWIGYKAIIAGVCRYVLCNDGRGRELKFSRAVFKSNNLKKEYYGVIADNIEKWMIFRH